MWVFESVTDKEEERSVCRCNGCAEVINNNERDLKNAMNTMEFFTVDKILKHILQNHIDIAEAETSGSGAAPEAREGARHQELHQVC